MFLLPPPLAAAEGGSNVMLEAEGRREKRVSLPRSHGGKRKKLLQGRVCPSPPLFCLFFFPQQMVLLNAPEGAAVSPSTIDRQASKLERKMPLPVILFLHVPSPKRACSCCCIPPRSAHNELKTKLAPSYKANIFSLSFPRWLRSFFSGTNFSKTLSPQKNKIIANFPYYYSR